VGETAIGRLADRIASLMGQTPTPLRVAWMATLSVFRGRRSLRRRMYADRSAQNAVSESTLSNRALR